MVQSSSSTNRSRTTLQHSEIQGIPVPRCDASTRLLRVRVLQASGLMKKNILGKSHPYCKIFLFKSSQYFSLVCPPVSTKNAKRLLDPTWNEEFIFRVNPAENRLVFELYDESHLTRDAFLGVVAVSLAHLDIGSEETGQRILPKSFLLRPKSPHSRVQGNLLLYFSYLPSTTDPRVTRASQLPLPRRFPTETTNQTAQHPAGTTTADTSDPSPTHSESRRTTLVELAESHPSPESQVSPDNRRSGSGTRVDPVNDSCSSMEFVNDPLPPGWDERVDQNNRVYYVDHVNRRTQWDRPVFKLPEGWEQRTDAQGRVYYVDHINNRTAWYHPLSRLANSLITPVSPPSADAQNESEPDGHNSDLESAPEDAEAHDQSSSSSDQVVNLVGPCGSASPTLIVSDSRAHASMREGAAARPSTSRSRTATTTSTAYGLTEVAEQNVNEEAIAARTMFLRRRVVSLEDTLPHPELGSDQQSERQSEGTTLTPRADEPPTSQPSGPTVASANGSPPAADRTDDGGTVAQTDMPRLTGPIPIPPDEEPLPPGWQLMLTAEGRRLFLNHTQKVTTWDDPRKSQSVLKRQTERHKFNDLGPLPPGWEERVDSRGRIFYIDHNRKTTQWEDPRLKTFSAPALPYSRDFKRNYDQFRSQLRGPRDPQAKLEIRVRRAHILEDSFRALNAVKRPEYFLNTLWIEFIGEKGLDYGGVQREWFFLLSREMFNPYYGLFEYSAADKYTLQINPLSGVANEDHLRYFKFIGRVVGLAVYNGKLIDGFLIRPFYKMMLGREITLKDMESVDAEYYRSLKYIMDNDPTVLDLTFSVMDEHFGRTVEVDLVPNGRNIAVTNSNKKRYIECIIDWRFASRVKDQMVAFLDGFKDIIDLKALRIFDANELELLICGLQDISVTDWRANTEYKGEYHDGHPVIVNFWKAVYTFPNELRSRLLQFVTGTSRVPMNGFAELWGSSGRQKFTIECVGSVHQFPRAHTCFNRLDLPPYTTFDQLRTKLIIAMENTEGFEGVD